MANRPQKSNSNDSYRMKGRGERKGEKEMKKNNFGNKTGEKNAAGAGHKDGYRNKDPNHLEKNKLEMDRFENKRLEKGRFGLEKESETKHFRRNDKESHRVVYENDFIFWCKKCNLPLIGEKCGICGSLGGKITLSQPADVRFAQGHDTELVKKHMIRLFSCDPLEGRVFLLNKIPGEDQSMEIIADGRVLGMLRFDLKVLDFVFEPTIEGAKLFLTEEYKHAASNRIVKIKKAKTHL